MFNHKKVYKIYLFLFIDNMKCKLLLIMCITILIQGCFFEKLWYNITNIQKDSIRNRYNDSISKDPDKIAEWEAEVKEYEAIIDKKIEAANKAGKLYRKIGESYAYFHQYNLCIKNLENAILLSNNNTEIFYTLGLCYGNLANKHNWKYEYSKKAEENFLKVLNLLPNHNKAKFQLGIIYLYGLGSNNQYRVLNDYITVDQKDFVQKAAQLLEAIKKEEPNNIKVYFELARCYQIQKKISLGIQLMEEVIELIKDTNYKNYKNLESYQIATKNLMVLKNTK